MNTCSKTPHGPDVLVVGEALIDVVNSPEGVSEHPGGSPANVAYGLGRLGIQTSFHTSIGRDPRGRAIAAHLNSAGVELLPGAYRDSPTATATATLSADGSASYQFDISWDPSRIAAPILPRILHAGSIASFLAPGDAVVSELVAQAHRRCLITYDPNIRPALLGSAWEARSTFEDLAAFANVIKLSNEDAAWLYPELTAEEAGKRILRLGPGMVVTTLGADGSLLMTPHGSVHVPAFPSPVVDTIGAGDSYMAALIYGLLARGTHGLTPQAQERLGRTAAAAAAITVSRKGAAPPTAGELSAWLQQASIPS